MLLTVRFPLLLTLDFRPCVRGPAVTGFQNERVANMEDEKSTLRSWNERLCGEVSALRDQRELAQVRASHDFLSI